MREGRSSWLEILTVAKRNDGNDGNDVNGTSCDNKRLPETALPSVSNANYTAAANKCATRTSWSLKYPPYISLAIRAAGVRTSFPLNNRETTNVFADVSAD